MQIPHAISGKRRWFLTRLIINGFCQAAATVANALLVELAFDELITTANSGFNNHLLWQIGLGLAAAAIVTALLRVLERADAERIGQDYAYEIRMILYERLIKITPTKFG